MTTFFCCSTDNVFFTGDFVTRRAAAVDAAMEAADYLPDGGSAHVYTANHLGQERVKHLVEVLTNGAIELDGEEI